MVTGSAQRVFRLGLAVGVSGAGAVVVAVIVALRALDDGLASAHEVVAACRSVLPSESAAEASLVLALTAVSVAVIARASCSMVRQLRQARRVEADAVVRQRIDVAGETVIVVDGSRPEAFCGGLLHPRVYITAAALECLSRDELEAVIAHERHHQAHRDPLRLMLMRVLRDGLFFLPALSRLTERYCALAELAADEAAAQAKGRQTLASALLAFGAAETPGVVVGIAPERVDQLLGHGPRWETPVCLLAGAAVTIAALMSLTTLTEALARGRGIELPVLVASACVLGLAGLIAVAALLVVGLSRPLLSRLIR